MGRCFFFLTFTLQSIKGLCYLFHYIDFLFCFVFSPQDQHSLLIKYQGLVVKQLISQSKKAEQEDDNKTEEEGADTIRKELQEITTSVKDLVLRPRKSSVTEE